MARQDFEGSRSCKIDPDTGEKRDQGLKLSCLCSFFSINTSETTQKLHLVIQDFLSFDASQVAGVAHFIILVPDSQHVVITNGNIGCRNTATLSDNKEVSAMRIMTGDTCDKAVSII